MLSSDTCAIAEDRFGRGVIEIPLRDRGDVFCDGVWVTLSRAHFARFLDLYEAEDREQTEQWFGWQCNKLPGYPDTLLLKTNLHLQPYPTRPRIELAPSAHPLAIEQRDGITMARWQEIIELNTHAA